MAKLKNFNGRYCEWEFENAFITYLEDEGWQYLPGSSILRDSQRDVLYVDDMEQFLRKANPELSAEEIELVKAIATFPETVKNAGEKYEPSFIARFAVDVAQKFNKFYFDCKILTAETDELKNFRLALTKATLQALENAFSLLGIGIPDKM